MHRQGNKVLRRAMDRALRIRLPLPGDGQRSEPEWVDAFVDAQSLPLKSRAKLAGLANELLYLRWFREHAEFGGTDENVKALLNDLYVFQTGRPVPDAYVVNELQSPGAGDSGSEVRRRGRGRRRAQGSRAAGASRARALSDSAEAGHADPEAGLGLGGADPLADPELVIYDD